MTRKTELEMWILGIDWQEGVLNCVRRWQQIKKQSLEEMTNSRVMKFTIMSFQASTIDCFRQEVQQYGYPRLAQLKVNFLVLIVMPHHVHALSRAFPMACRSLSDSATRVRSSPY